MRKIFLLVAILFAGFAWGADIKNFASGIENETIGFIAQDQCDAVAISTNAPRTGKQCLSTTFNGTGNRRWYITPTFEIPKDSCMHIIAWTKLTSSDNTPASSSTRAYANVYAGGNKNGTPVNLTKSWQCITASSAKATVEKFGAKARFFRTHANKREVLFDDIIVYVSDNPKVDLTAPTPATSASATETAITWTCGTDANTGVKATLIWKRIDGTAEDLTLNNQGIYALTATDGPKVDQSGHWELVKILPPDATSYSESEPFGNKEDYAIVHRDLAYNYSNPVYVTTPDMSVKTLYLKPGYNWKQAGARFAIYCSEGNQWYDMVLVDAGNSVYKAEVSAQYTTLKFCRMKGDDPTNALTNPPLWNKTKDLTMPSTETGAYVVPDGQWNDGDDSQWSTKPLSIKITSDDWLYFAGEQMTLTAISPGATHYQWYYKKHSTGDLLPIPGATTATYINYNFTYDDAGDYYCKSRIGTGEEITSGAFTVKTLRMYFNNAGEHGTAAYDYVDLKNTDPANKKASGMIILGGPWEYGFTVTDGTRNYYGNNGQMTTTSTWPMDVKDKDCRILTPKAAFSTYTFVVDYSDMTKPWVTANYPEKNQQPGKVVYFDNSAVNWNGDSLHYRIGRGDRGDANHTQAAPIDTVPGTANLFRYTTPEYNGLDAWHIANNCGHKGIGSDYSIYKTNTGDKYEVSNAIDYEGGAITQDITIVPKKDEHSAGTDSYNNNCQFYKYTTLQGMKAHNVMIDAPEHGSITVRYKDVTNHSQSFTSGERELAHTCILTITATPPSTCGYTTSLTVNGNPFTSGDTYILKERTTIDVEFIPDTFGVTLNTNEGVILVGDVKEYTYGVGATLPTQLSRTGKDFVGWYDNVDLLGTPVTDIPATVCGDKEYWAKWVDERPRIAFIISGTPNSEDFDTYTASEATACNSLVSYLRSEPYYFKIAFANGYATADETELAEYYEQFNLVVVTDFLNDDSYTNVIGTLIDQKPILSFETHVAGCPNWGISTTPKTPSTKQISITALCPEHQIFDPITASTDVVGFLTNASGTNKDALQGWSGVEAPKDMVFLATVADGEGGNLVVCCERQKVMEARMMIMGLNHDAMTEISADGKTIIRQIIEYLLQSSDASDCTIVFDDKSGDHKWSNAANWAPRYNRIPKAEQAVRIDQPCEVDIEDAHCSRIRLRKDGSTVNGSLTILPTGGLTVIDYIKQMNGTDYLNTVPSAAGDLDILANTSGRNGSLVFGNTEDDLQATIEYYSLATGAKTSTPVWQYIGIPVSDRPKAIESYYGAWMCSWEPVGNISSNWVWVKSEDKLQAFKGYCITQEAATNYYHQGPLCRPEAISLPFSYIESDDDDDGFNMFANSWVAPIDIAKIEESDFGDPTDADATIYIYNTGSRKQYEGSGGATDPGQFNVIPVHSSSYLPGVPTKIPTMQGFFIKANKAGTLTLDYKKICFDSDTYSTTAETMRAPRESDRPEVMQLIVSGEHYGDRVYLLAREDFSESFENGWDGRKIEGDENAPMLAVVKEAGDMAVAAIPSVEERELSFRAGSDTEYTFCFNYEGETIYLYDRLTGEATEIKTGNTYSFTAENKTAAKRFIITSNPPRIPTGIENTDISVQGSDAEKCIIDGQLYIIKNNRFYDARGVRVNSFKRKEVTL